MERFSQHPDWLLTAIEGDRAYIEGWLTPDGQCAASDHAMEDVRRRLDINGSGAVFYQRLPASQRRGNTGQGCWAARCASAATSTIAVATTQECDCEIAELVMYNRKLTDAERATGRALSAGEVDAADMDTEQLGSNLTAWFDSSNAATVQMAARVVNNWFSAVGTAVASQATVAYRPAYLSAGGVNCTLNTGLFGQNLPGFL